MDIDLKTPRTIDDENITKWSDEIEELLSEWGEIALCYGWLHAYSERKYKKKYHNMSIPIIVLSTLTGTANFADSYVPETFRKSFSAIVGGFNIFCGILGTLLSFLRYAEIYESHRISQISWSKFARNIQIELALKDSKRKNCRDFLKVSRAEYDRLIESSPNIDRDIINVFNNKFESEYPNVRKPIVCNGLKQIIIYKSEDEEDKPDMVDVLKKQENEKLNRMILEKEELIKIAMQSKPEPEPEL
jgi:hypothetical protein